MNPNLLKLLVTVFVILFCVEQCSVFNMGKKYCSPVNNTIIINNTIEKEVYINTTCSPCKKCHDCEVSPSNITKTVEYQRIVSQAKYCDKMLSRCDNLNCLQEIESLNDSLYGCKDSLSKIKEIFD